MDGSTHPRQGPSTAAVTPSLEMALELHRKNELEKAERIYEQILQRNPNHADALHLLGMLMHQRGQHGEAERLIERAIQVRPRQAIFYSNLGVVRMGAGEVLLAIDAYQIAELLEPESVENLNNLAVVLHAIGQTNEAVVCLKRVFLLRPEYGDARDNLLRLLQLQTDSAEGFHRLGDLLFEANRPGEAVAWYRKSLELNSESAETLNNLGNALFADGKQDEAVGCYQRAIAINPQFVLAWNNLANVLKELGKLAESIHAYERAIQLQPDSAQLISNLGNVLVEAKQFEAARHFYDRALAIDPAHAATLNHYGNLFCELGEWSAAMGNYQRALAVKPDYADAINNLGTALEESGRRDEAMECYQRARGLDESLVSPPWNIALLQLLRGEYDSGWRGYEYRWLQKKQCRTWREFDQPVLINLAVEQGTIVLLHAEQGLGDAIQFCRYAPMLAERGMRVFLECPAPLVSLFESLNGVERVVARGTPLPDFDVHCPFMSLPKVFGTLVETVPGEPYLRVGDATRKKWQAKFAGQAKSFRVGLVWAGQATHQKDRHRSISPAAFEGIGKLPGVTFYSLQVGAAGSQLKTASKEMPLVDWTDELTDFEQTAGLIGELDLVISVDTAVCHVAGAIGKPVWVLLAFQPDWRWMLGREESPWYRSARLFRQTDAGDWDGVLGRVEAEFAIDSRIKIGLLILTAPQWQFAVFL